MAEDIAPGLLLRIRAAFRKKLENDEEIRRLSELIESGKADYADAAEYARLCGQALSQAFGENFTAQSLPNGKAYFNIADRVLRPMLEEDHSLIATAAQKVQESLNRKAGLTIKAQKAEADEDRITGIIDKVSNAEQFEDVEWMLQRPVENFSLNIVDESIRKNVEFQGRAGLRPVVRRKAPGYCCEWCRSLVGEYEYPKVPKDVYRRHEDCRCSVTYDPGDGRRQNVWSKRWG